MISVSIAICSAAAFSSSSSAVSDADSLISIFGSDGSAESVSSITTVFFFFSRGFLGFFGEASFFFGVSGFSVFLDFDFSFSAGALDSSVFSRSTFSFGGFSSLKFASARREFSSASFFSISTSGEIPFSISSMNSASTISVFSATKSGWSTIAQSRKTFSMESHP